MTLTSQQAELLARFVGDDDGSLSDDEFLEMVADRIGDDLGTRKHEPYVWTVEIHIDPVWVADGFDLDEARLEGMLMLDLDCATSAEVGGKILKAPDPKQIRAEQGYKEEGYKPRNPDL